MQQLVKNYTLQQALLVFIACQEPESGIIINQKNKQLLNFFQSLPPELQTKLKRFIKDQKPLLDKLRIKL